MGRGRGGVIELIDEIRIRNVHIMVYLTGDGLLCTDIANGDVKTLAREMGINEETETFGMCIPPTIDLLTSVLCKYLR